MPAILEIYREILLGSGGAAAAVKGESPSVYVRGRRNRKVSQRTVAFVHVVIIP